MKFAKIVFSIAGAWGVAILTPMYFLYDAFGRMYPPPINHPEMYYGFLGVTMAWQIVYFVIASNPPRFRPIMVTGMLAKFSYFATLLVLFSQGRIVAEQLAAGTLDLVLGALFVVAFLKTRRSGDSAAH